MRERGGLSDRHGVHRIASEEFGINMEQSSLHPCSIHV